MVPAETLNQIRERFQFLEAKMAGGAEADEIAALAKEYADLRPVVAEIEAYQAMLDAQAQAEAMLDDAEMKALAEEELEELKTAIPEAEQNLRVALLPKDAADARPAIIEIRPGTGGEEAALFAGDLLRMYQRYAEGKGWRFNIIEHAETELGGVKEVIANVSGEGVFARLKYESGVHRVQRVPETESGGRIHTSAATVAVLPEAEDVDIDIPATDIRIDTMRASGAGGQHVNTTDSAVRIHAYSVWHCRDVFREITAPEPRDCDGAFARKAVRYGAPESGCGTCRRAQEPGGIGRPVGAHSHL